MDGGERAQRGPAERATARLFPLLGRGGAERPLPTEQTTCRPAPAPCPRDPRTRSRPPCGSSPNGQDRVRAWGAQRLEPRCRASGRRTMVVIVAQLSYIEHGSQEVLRSEEQKTELQSLMRTSYAVFFL